MGALLFDLTDRHLAMLLLHGFLESLSEIELVGGVRAVVLILSVDEA